MFKHIAAVFITVVFIPTLFLATMQSQGGTSVKANAAAPIESAVSSAPAAGDQKDGVLAARLEHLLNLNRIYDEAFGSDRELIEEVSILLLDQSEADEYGQRYIKQSLVLPFIHDLYGIDADPSAAVYEYLPAPAGYFAIPARGYDTVTHKLLDLAVNEDGTITVHSEMTGFPHDGETYTVRATTVFRAAAGSPFGYQILSSDIAD